MLAGPKDAKKKERLNLDVDMSSLLPLFTKHTYSVCKIQVAG